MLYIIVIYPIYHCDASYSYISYISWIITINEYIYIYIYTYITHISIYWIYWTYLSYPIVVYSIKPLRLRLRYPIDLIFLFFHIYNPIYIYIYHDDVSYSSISKKTIDPLRLRISHWGQVLEHVLRWSFRRPRRIPRAAAPCCASRSNVRRHAERSYGGEQLGGASRANHGKIMRKFMGKTWENGKSLGKSLEK